MPDLNANPWILLVLLNAKWTEFSGGLTTSSKLNAGVVNFFNLDVYIGCFKPSEVSSISTAIPTCVPVLDFLTLPPDAVAMSWSPQQIAKIFFSNSKSFFAKLICLLISIVLS